MNLNNNVAQAIATATLETFNLTNLEVDHKLAHDSIKQEILSEYTELNSERVKHERCQHFGVGKPEDYSETLFQLTDGRKMICGIRHLGGNSQWPFVNCVPSFEFQTKEEVVRTYSEIKKHFKVFKPKHISLWSKRDFDADLFGSTYLVSSAKEIKSKTAWSNENQINLKPITDDSYYSWYKKEYDELQQLPEHLKNKVLINDKETMDESLEHGLLSFVEWNGQKIGLIAATKENFLGRRGIYFNEILISQKWKGQGLAKAVQRKFICENVLDNYFVWGTIDRENTASYKTALANGRIPVRYECFVKLDGGRHEL